MISTLLGLWTGMIKNLTWISYSAVEALIFMWVFNYIAPELPAWGFTLPVDHIGYWFALATFLMIGFVGGWISKLTPKLVNINNSSKSDS